MKILHIINAFTGGAARVVEQIVNDNNKRGVVSAIAHNGEHIGNVKTHFYKTPLSRGINLIKDFRGYYALAKVIDEFQPDIIHCHCAKAGAIGSTIAKFKKIPVCYSPHGYAFLRTDISWITKKLYYGLEKIIASFSNATTIACGANEYDYAKKLSSAILIANSVELTTPPCAEQENLIVTIGRITTQKGIEQYIEMVKQSPITWQWLWIGDGEQRNKLAALPNVKITGWLPHTQVMELLATASIYLQTSLWEGLPLSVLEAMSLAKPVVCSNITAYQDVIQSEQNGLLFATPMQAITEIERLLNDPAWRRQIAQAAQTTIQQQFNAEQNIPLYFECYKKLLK